MPGLSDTLAAMRRYRRAMESSAADALQVAGAATAGKLPHGRSSSPGIAARGGLAAGVVEVPSFGANPGELRMLGYVPAGLPTGAALVVVLHGCGQTAAEYGVGSGWVELAQRFGFALVLPEQRRANNAGGCFNWFSRADTQRGGGEAASVRSMIGHAVTAWGADRRRVSVTGLSAGGAFANVMLATYPELFAGGSIVAGLPYGVAQSTQAALELMHRAQPRTQAAWGGLVRGASTHAAPWPRISIWHGSADTTVIPSNGMDVARQWVDVHGLDLAAGVQGSAGPAGRMMWSAQDGTPAVELFTLPGLAHGVPISTKDAEPLARCGMAAPFILEAGISSAYCTARDWGLTGAPFVSTAAAPGQAPQAATPTNPAPVSAGQRGVPAVAAVITRALRAAGLGE